MTGARGLSKQTALCGLKTAIGVRPPGGAERVLAYSYSRVYS